MSKRVRCAIYTRKSTEEGLEQDCNSLDAQREACEAYIWTPADDLAHFVIEAVERVDLGAFKVNHRGTGSAQYHPG